MKYVKLTFNLLYFVIWKKKKKERGILKSDSETKHYFLFCPKNTSDPTQSFTATMHIHSCVL